MGELPFYGGKKSGPPLEAAFLVGRPRLERGTNWLKPTALPTELTALSQTPV